MQQLLNGTAVRRKEKKTNEKLTKFVKTTTGSGTGSRGLTGNAVNDSLVKIHFCSLSKTAR